MTDTPVGKCVVVLGLMEDFMEDCKNLRINTVYFSISYTQQKDDKETIIMQATLGLGGVTADYRTQLVHNAIIFTGPATEPADQETAQKTIFGALEQVKADWQRFYSSCKLKQGKIALA